MIHSRHALLSALLMSTGCLAGSPPPVAGTLLTTTTTVVIAPPAPVAPPTPLEVATTPFGSTREVAGSFRGEVFAIPERTRQLPDFDGLSPLGSVYTHDINISPRHCEQGFPGVTDRIEWFAVRYQGTFRVANGGPHRFRVLSDDGARLLLDGQPILVNDGVHAPSWAEGGTYLAPGEHHITLEYFQGPRFEVALQLFWSPPGQPESLFRIDA